jgi:PAS domain-containing protein
VFAVLEEGDGTIRVGTLAGLFTAEGNRLVRPADSGPVVDRPVYFMTRDVDGRLWLGTDNGVFRWDGESVRHYTVHDGLVGRETNRAAGVVDSRGRIWIGMDRGLSVYRREFDEMHVVPPLLELLDIEIAERRHPMAQPAELLHRENTLVFRFRATSFVDEHRMQVRSWLEGFDPDWSEPRPMARGEMRYTNLPPGRYRFHVQAANAAGVWSETRRSAPIVIQAPMWRQPWAVLIGVALAAAVAYGLHRVAAQRRYARTLEREVETQIAALRLSEERVHRVRRAEMRRLDLTLGSIADGVVATDRLGRVILINPAAATITGWSPFDAVGRSVRDVLPLQANDDAAREIDPMTIPERAKRHIDHDVTLSDPRGAIRA